MRDFLSRELAAHQAQLAADPRPAEPAAPLPAEPDYPTARWPWLSVMDRVLPSAPAHLPLSMAGALRNGAERGGGTVRHAVPAEPGRSIQDHGAALCGRAPSIMWSSHPGEAVTCPRCLARLAKEAP